MCHGSLCDKMALKGHDFLFILNGTNLWQVPANFLFGYPCYFLSYFEAIVHNFLNKAKGNFSLPANVLCHRSVSLVHAFWYTMLELTAIRNFALSV
jgi:hypothetical protein